MAIKHVKGEFSFPAEFGFTGSAQGRHDPKEHVDQDDGEYGDGLAKGGKARRNRSMQEHHDETEYAHRGKRHFAGGGPMEAMPAPPPAAPPAAPPMQEPTISMPMSTAKHVARKLVQAGAVHGAKAAVQGLAGVARARQAQGAPSAPPPPARSPLPPQGALSGMAEGGKFIQGMHMKKGALHRELGIPEGKKIPEERLESAAHSGNKLLAKRANTALTLKGMRHRKD